MLCVWEVKLGSARSLSAAIMRLIGRWYVCRSEPLWREVDCSITRRGILSCRVPYLALSGLVSEKRCTDPAFTLFYYGRLMK